MLELLALAAIIAIGYWTWKGMKADTKAPDTKSEPSLEIPVAPVLTQQLEIPNPVEPSAKEETKPKKTRKPRAKKSAE